MIQGFAILLFCQLVGEVAARALGLPIPGPVLGLALLVAGLGVWSRLRQIDDTRIASSAVARVADALLGVLALLFVPAGVGLVQHAELLRTYGVALGVALVGSTLLTLIATVGVFLAVKWLTGNREQETRETGSGPR
jgi:holin-like protein